MPTVKENVVAYLEDLATECKPTRLSNLDTSLCDAYIWQEVMNLAAQKYKTAMAELADTVSVTDDEIREYAVGEHSISTGNRFCLIAKIQACRQNFDKDIFIEKAAKKFAVPLAKLKALAEISKKDSKAPLSKRVVEL